MTVVDQLPADDKSRNNFVFLLSNVRQAEQEEVSDKTKGFL